MTVFKNCSLQHFDSSRNMVPMGLIVKNSSLWNGLEIPFRNVSLMTLYNQSVENAGVAFVKGAHERNELKKMKKKKKHDEQGKGLTILGTNWFEDELLQVAKGWCINAPVERFNDCRYFQWKQKVLQSSMPLFCLFSYAIVNFIFECYRNIHWS